MGQYEIVTGPLPPLEAADAVVFTHETIINIASKHGLHATFSPRVYKNTCNPSIILLRIELLKLCPS
jgi:glutamine synthetase